MKRHLFHAEPRHKFHGSDTEQFCGHIAPDGDLCIEERDHPLHHYETDPDLLLLRRMQGRRDYRDITEGNSQLTDRGN